MNIYRCLELLVGFQVNSFISLSDIKEVNKLGLQAMAAVQELGMGALHKEEGAEERGDFLRTEMKKCLERLKKP